MPKHGNEWRGPTPRLSAWTTQVRRNVAAVASRWLHCVRFSGVRKGEGGFGGQPPIDDLKKIKTFLFEMIRFFSYRVCRNCCHGFLCYTTCLLIPRNFHCDAIIPVVKLFWWVALEPTTNPKCKPGQTQWVLLKLESCWDVMMRLFSTAIKAERHNVPA